MPSEQRFTFDEVGDLYDRYRPGYPEQLFDDLVTLSGLPPAGRVLEIGCGSGQATLPLAQRGCAIVCLEPGPRLARIAREKLASFVNVEILCETFESWQVEPAAFNLVLSAQAFHWLLPDFRFSKSAAALQPDGSLAVVGNAVVAERSPLRETLDAAYARYAPSIEGPAVTRWYAAEGPIASLFAASRCFSPPVWRRYQWSQRYTTSAYLDLLRTHSDHRTLPTDQRERLLAAVSEIIDHHGGTIEVSYETHLYVGRRAA